MNFVKRFSQKKESKSHYVNQHDVSQKITTNEKKTIQHYSSTRTNSEIFLISIPCYYKYKLYSEIFNLNLLCSREKDTDEITVLTSQLINTTSVMF